VENLKTEAKPGENMKTSFLPAATSPLQAFPPLANCPMYSD